MSEETPPLRLKSRPRPEVPPSAESAPAEPTVPAGETPVPSPTVETPPPRERAKPRLSAVAPSPSAPPPPPEPEPVIPLFSDPTKPEENRFAATAALALAATPEPGPADATASTPPPPASPPAAPGDASGSTAPHAPGLYISVAPASGGKSPYPRPLHLHLEGEVATEAAPAPVPVKPEEKPAFKYGVVLVFLLAMTVIGGGAFLILRFLGEATATPKSEAAAPTTVVKPSAAPLPADKPATVAPVAATTHSSTPPPATGAAEEPSSPMGRALAKAREVTGQAVVEKGTVEEIAAPSQVATPSDPLLPEPRASEPSRGVVVVDSAATSPEYIAFVEATRISGVFQGATPRALINGRTVRVGTLIDVGLGVYFHGLDTERRQVVFRDSRGLIIRKGY